MIEKVTCVACREQLIWYLTDHLPVQERTVLEAHLATCASCRQELVHWREIAGALLQEDRRIPPDLSAAEAWDTLRERLPAQPPRGGEPRRWLRFGAETKGDLPMLQGQKRDHSSGG